MTYPIPSRVTRYVYQTVYRTTYSTQPTYTQPTVTFSGGRSFMRTNADHQRHYFQPAANTHFFCHSSPATPPTANYTNATTGQPAGERRFTWANAGYQSHYFQPPYTHTHSAHAKPPSHSHHAPQSAANSDNSTSRQKQAENAIWIEGRVALIVDGWREIIKTISDNSGKTITEAALRASCTKTLRAAAHQKLASGDCDLRHSSQAVSDFMHAEAQRFLYPLLHSHRTTPPAANDAHSTTQQQAKGHGLTRDNNASSAAP